MRGAETAAVTPSCGHRHQFRLSEWGPLPWSSTKAANQFRTRRSLPMQSPWQLNKENGIWTRIERGVMELHTGQSVGMRLIRLHPDGTTRRSFPPSFLWAARCRSTSGTEQRRVWQQLHTKTSWTPKHDYRGSPHTGETPRRNNTFTFCHEALTACSSCVSVPMVGAHCASVSPATQKAHGPAMSGLDPRSSLQTCIL